MIFYNALLMQYAIQNIAISHIGCRCLYEKGSGLPAGPGGILGAGEGLAYLAVLAGFLVLVAQVTNFGECMRRTIFLTPHVLLHIFHLYTFLIIKCT